MPSVAVVGTGYWGKNLVRNFHQIGALKMICDKNETVLGTLQAQNPGVEICYALTDVLKRDDIQGVVIATPAETHFRWHAKPCWPASTFTWKNRSC